MEIPGWACLHIVENRSNHGQGFYFEAGSFSDLFCRPFSLQRNTFQWGPRCNLNLVPTCSKVFQTRQATQEDWQVPGEDDFLQLEPWAVPCSNQWMKLGCRVGREECWA